MEEKLQAKNKKSHILRYIAIGAVFFLLIVYAVYSIANISSQIKEKEAELQALNHEIRIAEVENNELQEVLGFSDEEYLEYVLRKAHNDLGYVREGERVFEIISGE